MTPEFYSEYLKIKTRRKKVTFSKKQKNSSLNKHYTMATFHFHIPSFLQLLYVMNPNKFRACQVNDTVSIMYNYYAHPVM